MFPVSRLLVSKILNYPNQPEFVFIREIRGYAFLIYVRQRKSAAMFLLSAEY